MYICKPKEILNGRSAHDNGWLRMKRNSAKFFFENRAAQPAREKYKEAAEYLTESTDIQFSPKKVEQLLELYPHARILLALEDGTHVRSELLDAAANFILGCSWPLNADNIDIDSFLALLQDQASQMKFTLVKKRAE